VRLPRIASFRDHDGYSGTIWRLGASGPQFELCAGPHEPRAGAGWTLEVPGTTGPDPAAAGPEAAATDPGDCVTDPEGYAWQARPQATAPVGVRPTRRPEYCRAFYEELLGLPVLRGPAGLTVTLPAQRGIIRLESAASAPDLTIEDMLVFYFADPPARDQLAELLLDAGAPPVRPHNPWWHSRARCVADPDGIVIALAVDP
jgi:hypothetical protein